MEIEIKELIIGTLVVSGLSFMGGIFYGAKMILDNISREKGSLKISKRQ